jgi:hypothetical protein
MITNNHQPELFAKRSLSDTVEESIKRLVNQIEWMSDQTFHKEVTNIDAYILRIKNDHAIDIPILPTAGTLDWSNVSLCNEDDNGNRVYEIAYGYYVKIPYEGGATYFETYGPEPKEGKVHGEVKHEESVLFLEFTVTREEPREKVRLHIISVIQTIKERLDSLRKEVPLLQQRLEDRVRTALRNL